MNWIHVNFYTNNGPEIMDVSEMKFKKKRKTDWLLLLLKSLSICTYVPTGIKLLTYVLSNKKDA